MIEASEIPEDTLTQVIWIAFLESSPLKEATVFHSALLFMEEGATYLIHNKNILSPTLEYIFDGFNSYYQIPKIQSCIFNCLMDISKKASQSFTEEIFEKYLSFIENNASLIEKQNWSNSMEGIWSICSVVDDEKIPKVMLRIL